MTIVLFEKHRYSLYPFKNTFFGPSVTRLRDFTVAGVTIAFAPHHRKYRRPGHHFPSRSQLNGDL